MISNDHTSTRGRIAGGISSLSIHGGAADIVSVGWGFDVPPDSGITLDFKISIDWRWDEY